MNILYVSAILPYPLFSGGQVRVYNLLKRLAKDHSIILCSFIRKEEERKYLDELSFCKQVHTVLRGRAWQPSYLTKSLLGSYPFVMATYNLAQMRACISEQLHNNHIDCIHIEPGYVWPSVPETNIPIVVSEHNIEHRVYEEYLSQYPYPIVKHLMKRDINKLKKWEQFIWKKAEYVVTVSEEDAEEIRKIKKNNLTVVPNGIDENTFRFSPRNTVTETCTCLFVGNFRWIQNIDAVRFLLTDIWPSIHTAFPNSTLRIVGREFPKNLRSRLPKSVRVLSEVENITNEFNVSDIVFAPIRIGGGTKYKILEAMASGIPVITTTKGTQGMPLFDNKNCYIANKPNEWVEKMRYIMQNPKINRSVVSEARKLVEQQYSWNTISAKLSAVWNHVGKKE